MELIVSAQRQPVLHHVIDHRVLIFVGLPGFLSDIVLDTLPVASILQLHASHRNLCRRHKLIIDLTLRRIRNRLLHRGRSGLTECYFLSEILIPINLDHGRIKAQYVFITYAIGNAVAMQFITENIGCRTHRLFVFRKDRRSGKTEKEGLRECLLNR